jgi:putative phage-type endonuclease
MEFLNEHEEELQKILTQISFDTIYHTLEEYSNNHQILELKQIYKELFINTIDDLDSDMIYYTDLIYDKWFTTLVVKMYNLYKKREGIKHNMNSLKLLKLPDQRSEEWYKIRENLLTASSLADALGKGHFQTRDDLLIDKTRKEKKEFVMHDIMQWGVKYEPVATMFYEYLYKVKVIEFGLIPHSKLSVFGASPDGICDIDSPPEYIGRMLEIKCPPRRKFTHEVPKHYWMQMQGQLEVCDLEECDFFQVKLEEYGNVNEYEKDLLFDNGIQHGKTSDGLPKGLIIAYTKKDENTINIEYKYSPWMNTLDNILQWKIDTCKELETDYDIYEMKWWKITRYECSLVYRDNDWWLSVVPAIIKFWKDVVHYREVGNEDVQKRIDGRKRKPKYEKKVITINKEYQMLESDED